MLYSLHYITRPNAKKKKRKKRRKKKKKIVVLEEGKLFENSKIYSMERKVLLAR